jgi:hypothetical protein
LSDEVSRPQKVALRKISKIDRHRNAWRHKGARKGFPLGSCNGFVLCGIPYRGRMSLRILSALRTGFPLPSIQALLCLKGAGPTATGRLHCYICNFSRVAQATLQCKSRIALFLALFRDFLRITTGLASRNPFQLWKEANSCGKHAEAAKIRCAGLLRAAKSSPNPSVHSRRTASPAPPAATP